MALYIPHSIFHLVRLLYVMPETFGPTLVHNICFDFASPCVDFNKRTELRSSDSKPR